VQSVICEIDVVSAEGNGIREGTIATISRFEDILAWQIARGLVRDVYRICNETPIKTDYGMRGQITRAAISIMSNIAEGYGRRTHSDFAHFLDVARASCMEVQSLLYVALDVEYIPRASFEKLYQTTAETIAMITKFLVYLRAN
jgi:four helix bundle protein